MSDQPTQPTDWPGGGPCMYCDRDHLAQFCHLIPDEDGGVSDTPPKTQPTEALTWVSEGDRLPRIGQQVLVATPRQAGEMWDIETKVLLARHEDVIPHPVRAGGQWPTDYYWGSARSRDGNVLITGNGWWASLSSIPLPPGAEHASHNGYDFVRQIGDQFIA